MSGRGDDKIPLPRIVYSTEVDSVLERQRYAEALRRCLEELRPFKEQPHWGFVVNEILDALEVLGED